MVSLRSIEQERLLFNRRQAYRPERTACAGKRQERSHTVIMSKLKKKKKPLFHKPQTTGELRKIPASIPVKILSIGSLLLLAALIAFAIYASVTKGAEFVALSGGFALKGTVLYALLAVVACLIAGGFRLAVRFIPIEMWRLPAGVKAATIKTEGRYLKIATLLIELETILAIGYIMVTLYCGQIPGELPLIVWVAAVAATIIFLGRYVLIAAEKK